MHELGRYIADQLAKQGMKPAELERRSGVKKQTISNYLNDPRGYMDQTPHRKTLENLARGLGVPLSDVLVAAARAIGVPKRDLPESLDPSTLSDEWLTRELAQRLSDLRKGVVDHVRSASIDQAGVSPAQDELARHRKVSETEDTFGSVIPDRAAARSHGEYDDDAGDD
jgi:transcriptional regulator with XRE-family HTH domain